MTGATRSIAVGLVLLLPWLAGCQIGPGRLKAANTHYSDAVRIALSEEILVNLARMRYRDLPSFLAVSSISTQFEFETSLQAGGSIVSGGSDSALLGAGVRYSERPTMTFSILGGEEFQKRMLRPLTVVAISLLAESGWRGDRVLRITAEKLNGLKNAPSASGPTPDRAPEYRGFIEATALMNDLTDSGLVDFEFETRVEELSAPISRALVTGEDAVSAVQAGIEFRSARTDQQLQLVTEKRTLVMRFNPASDGNPDARRLRELLRLEAGRRRFDVVSLEDSEFDLFDEARRYQELAIDARSLMGVLYYLSNGVRVPDEDIEAGLVTATTDGAGQMFQWHDLLGGLFDVHWSDDWTRPDKAAVAVHHRGRWFYIADGDQNTRSTFLLLSQIFSLQAGNLPENKPVLTLPVGGSN
jgi:hypothetical protein